MNPRAALAHLGWVAAGVPAYRRFQRALLDPAAAQERWLHAHLARHGTSAYGRNHGCDVTRSYPEFARQVPIVDYDAVESWVTRIRHGDTHVLTNEPVTRLLPTSGTTNARKLLPFTAGLQSEFNAAIGPWMVDLALRQPTILLGPAYWSVTPLDGAPAPEASVVPIGFADDREYLGGARAWLIAGAMAVPPAVRHLADPAIYRRTVLLHLLRRGDLRLISVWHPSFLELLLDTLVRDWDEICAELAAGGATRRAQQLLSADPRRPSTLWPQLRLVSCWADAQAAGPAAQLQQRLPGVLVQPKGLLATEAFVTLPFAGAHPVAINSHFFEFIDAAGRVKRVADLKLGESCEVVVTTGGGLWRYRLGDQVEVDGFVGRTPSLRFIGRGRSVSDCCGEKLSEAFVGAVLRRLCGVAPFAMLAPEAHAGSWRYVLFLETGRAGLLPSVDQLDSALQENPHYVLCRQLGQLGAPRVVTLAAGAYQAYVAAEIARGLRMGEIKPVALSGRAGWTEHFKPVMAADV